MAVQQGLLNIIGPSEITELRVLDTYLREIAVGTHRLRVRLPQGIYQVEAQIPGDRASKLVAIEVGREVTVSDFNLKFDSYVPLASVRSTHEFHQGPARIYSQTVHARLSSQGAAELTARLFLFARTQGDGRTTLPTFTVKSPDRTEISFPEKGDYNLAQGWLALTMDLLPGTYTLEQDVPSIGRRAQAVFVEEGWETQVFMPWDDFPDFAKAVIFMRRGGQGFDPNADWEYEPTEAALEGLMRGRLVLNPNKMREIFDGKFENPMLGMLVCYSLLEQPQVDYQHLQRIARNLVELIPHSSDGRLIMLLAELSGASPSVVVTERWPQFTEPPLLAIGTERLMQLASHITTLCPSESYLASVAVRLTTGSLWTRWEADVRTDEAFNNLYIALQSRIFEMQQDHLFAGVTILPMVTAVLLTERNLTVPQILAQGFQLPQSVVNLALDVRRYDLTFLVKDCQGQIKVHKYGSLMAYSLSCAEIVRRATQGDSKALTALLEISRPFLEHRCPRNLREMKKDIIQEVDRRLTYKFRDPIRPYQPSTLAEYYHYLDVTMEDVLSSIPRGKISIRTSEHLQERYASQLTTYQYFIALQELRHLTAANRNRTYADVG